MLLSPSLPGRLRRPAASASTTADPAASTTTIPPAVPQASPSTRLLLTFTSDRQAASYLRHVEQEDRGCRPTSAEDGSWWEPRRLADALRPGRRALQRTAPVVRAMRAFEGAAFRMPGRPVPAPVGWGTWRGAAVLHRANDLSTGGEPCPSRPWWSPPTS